MRKYNSNSISRNNNYNGVGGAGGGGTASDIAYDNSLSGLVSENVQQAIDELHDEIEIGNIYSTDEKKVGEWIDGKPVYELVIDLGNNVAIASGVFPKQDILHGLNCELFLDGFMIINDNEYTGYYNPMEIGKNINNYKYTPLETWSAKPDRNVKCYIKYTKTTD